MATRVINDSKLQNIAVAIQGKDGGGTMTVDEMPTRIAAIPEVLFSSKGRQYTRTVEMPDNVTRKVIGKKVTSTANSFYCCTALRTAILSNVSTIGQNTFLAATALENVDCRNVDKIALGAFNNCKQLNLIDLTSRTTPTILDSANAFYETNNTWIAVVANDTIKSDFQNTTNWSTFASHFKTIAEVEAEVGMTYDEYYYQLFGEPRNEVAA